MIAARLCQVFAFSCDAVITNQSFFFLVDDDDSWFVFLESYCTLVRFLNK